MFKVGDRIESNYEPGRGHTKSGTVTAIRFSNYGFSFRVTFDCGCIRLVPETDLVPLVSDDVNKILEVLYDI